jgi:Arc/MetJ-type ribon-helix-helix transcriptional regulator
MPRNHVANAPRATFLSPGGQRSFQAPCNAAGLFHIPSQQMVQGWCGMTSKIQELRPKAAESEKITINVGYVDLGHIDLLVQEGFYSNRTDFIRTAIRNQLERHNDAVKQSVARQQLDLGLRQYSRQDLETVQAAGETLNIQVVGLAVIAADVSPELARDTIASIRVLGALQASPSVKAALSDRMH